MIFSTGYMHDDESYSRFFCTLGLFVFSMLGIVLADNFVMMFVFWELVGVSSYLLIGFWHSRPAAGDAAKKAFLTNRLGDFGFILGILIVWSAIGSVNFTEIASALAKNPAALGTMASLAGVLVFMGAMGKSAQFPLHVWLPDAMEGPTPVSALIHAATMVAAGVFLVARVFPLMAAAPEVAGAAAEAHAPHTTALTVVTWVGAITAVFACGQWSRLFIPLIFGVRPNSPQTTIATSRSKPRSCRSVTSADRPWSSSGHSSRHFG